MSTRNLVASAQLWQLRPIPTCGLNRLSVLYSRFRLDCLVFRQEATSSNVTTQTWMGLKTRVCTEGSGFQLAPMWPQIENGQDRGCNLSVDSDPSLHTAASTGLNVLSASNNSLPPPPNH